MNAAPAVSRIRSVGVAVEMGVAGLYAWSTTVAPIAWRDDAPVTARVAAVAAPLFLVGGSLVEPLFRSRRRVPVVAFWSFIVASAAAWIATPEGAPSLKVDWIRALAGMFGWGLFALTSASSPLRAHASRSNVVHAESKGSNFDHAWLVAGVLGAIILQSIGWNIRDRDHALLVRFMTIAAGVLALGIAADLATPSKHGSGVKGDRSRLLLSSVVLATLVGAGLLLTKRG